MTILGILGTSITQFRRPGKWRRCLCLGGGGGATWGGQLLKLVTAGAEGAALAPAGGGGERLAAPSARRVDAGGLAPVGGPSCRLAGPFRVVWHMAWFDERPLVRSRPVASVLHLKKNGRTLRRVEKCRRAGKLRRGTGVCSLDK